jgi:hypothetical protein
MSERQPTGRPTGEEEVRAGIAQLEGYLLLERERTTAHQEAEAFAQHLPWLTTVQHEEVVHLYTQHRLAVSQRIWQATAHRARQLRAEYQARYDALRRRLMRRCVALYLAAAALGVLCVALLALFAGPGCWPARL